MLQLTKKRRRDYLVVVRLLCVEAYGTILDSAFAVMEHSAEKAYLVGVLPVVAKTTTILDSAFAVLVQFAREV